MEALAWLFLILIVGVMGFLVFSIERGHEDVKAVKSSLPTEEELKKLKKADLVTFAGANGISVDPKSTKAVIIEAIKNS